MPNYKDPDGNLHYLDDADFAHLLPAGSIEISDEEADAIDSEKNPPMTQNEQINAQIVALEVSNPITHRMLREFILGFSQVIAASQGVTRVQLLDPKDQHYLHAFAAFVDVNSKAAALRAQLT